VDPLRLGREEVLGLIGGHRRHADVLGELAAAGDVVEIEQPAAAEDLHLALGFLDRSRRIARELSRALRIPAQVRVEAVTIP